MRPVICRFLQANERFACVSIAFLKTDKTKDLLVRPGDKAWNLAKAYALQGAAYHGLFVVHPTLHFPMDSVNAITKTAVPMIHPLFQALLPHTAYTLPLDNAVLEGAWTVVNDKVHETWFDPLTATGYNVKQLFGVGYSGYKGLAAYPAFDYMAPWMDAEQLLSASSEELYRPHRREIVVLFLDLRGYTAFTQKHGADEVMRILGEFHAAMGEIIATYEATLERFAGDGMMIFLNDPVEIADPAVKAGKMALDMQVRFHELNKIWQQRNYSLSMGIGIAQGMATIGAIGFEGRRDYAAIGGVTNLAARLCSEAGAGQILISSVVADNIEKTLRVQSLGELVLKGFSEPVRCFEIAHQLRPDAVEQVKQVKLAAPVGV